MAQTDALRTYLEDDSRTVENNLRFGINLLLSLEFPIVSKYQILLEYFNKNVGRFRKELQKSDSNNFDTRWRIVNKFLALEFPYRAVSSSTLDELLCILAKEAEKGKVPSLEYLNTFLTVLANNSFKHFFKFNSEKYGVFVGKLLDYCHKLSSVQIVPEESLKVMFEDLGHNVKTASINTAVRQIFYDNILSPLTKVVMNAPQNFKTMALGYLQQLYFTEENLEKYTRLFSGGNKASDDIINVFSCDNSKDTLLLCIEGFFKTYQSVPTPLIEFIFERLFNPAAENFSTIDCLSSIKELFTLLNRYNLKVQRPEIVDEFDPVNYLQEKLETICNDYCLEYLRETMEIVIVVIACNPLLIERKAFSVLTSCMFTVKPVEVMPTYEKFVNSIMQMTQQLKRGEYFVVYLTKAVREKLEDFKIPKKLKRKESDLNSSTATKKRRLENGDAVDSSFEVVTRFDGIGYAWPYASTEKEFTNLIVQLTSKQAITVWRLLTEFLRDELATLNVTDENQLFRIELISALNCQFLTNTQLAESLALFLDLVEERVTTMRSLLRDFGQKLLQIEHNRRLVSCFLNICYDFGCFEALIWYYRPDSCDNDLVEGDNHPELIFQEPKKQSRLLHNYLSSEEWKLIEQRVKNFGKFECIRCMNWINLQNIHMALLFGDRKLLKKQWDGLAANVVQETSLVSLIVRNESFNSWFFDNLNPEQMKVACSTIVEDEKCLEAVYKTPLLDNSNFVRTLAFEMLRKIFTDISFENVHLDEIVKSIEEPIAVSNYEVPLRFLNRLPLGFLDQDTRLLCFFMILKILNSTSTSATTIETVNELLTTLVNFDESPDIFGHISIVQLFQILNQPRFDKLLQLILNQTIFYMTEGAHEAYKKFVKDLKKKVEEPVYFQIATKILKTWAVMHFLKSKAVTKEQIEKLHYKLADLMFERLAKVTEDEMDGTCECFQAVIRSYIGRKNKTDDQVVAHNELLQKYLNQLIDSPTPDFLNLIILVLEYKSKFKLELETIKRLVKLCWKTFKKNTKILTKSKTKDEKLLKLNNTLAALIYDLKDSDELQTIYTELKQTVENNEQSITFTSRIFQQIAEHGITKSKTNEALTKNQKFGLNYGETMFNILYPMVIDSEPIQRLDVVEEILKAHIAVVGNIRVPLTAEIVESILYLLVRIQIDKLKVDDTNVEQFVELHQLMAELLFILMQSRAEVTLNYVSSFVHVFEALLVAVNNYKVDRTPDVELTNSEVSLLSDLSHKMEKITNLLVKHDKAVKLVCPFIVTKVINIMVSHKRASTSYEKVKNIFKNICYALIDIIEDHHRKFTSIASDMATRNLFEELLRDYKRFKAFRGKI